MVQDVVETVIGVINNLAVQRIPLEWSLSGSGDMEDYDPDKDDIDLLMKTEFPL